MATIMWSAEQSEAAEAGSHLTSAAEWPDRVLCNLIKYLSPQDACSFAATCKNVNEVVSRDDLWQKRLENMGVWNDKEAKSKKLAEQNIHADQELDKEEREDDGKEVTKKLEEDVSLLDLSSDLPSQVHPPDDLPADQPNPLTPFHGIVCEYGKARSIYSNIYRNLAPYYYDVVQKGAFQEPLLFQLFDQPEDQARALVNLRRFTLSLGDNDFEEENRDQLASISETFENAALREFELGIDEGDFTSESRVRRYALVLKQLGATESCVELFIHKRVVVDVQGELLDKERGQVNLGALQARLERVIKLISEQIEPIDVVFATDIDNVMFLYCKIMVEDTIIDPINHILEAVRETNVVNYLDAVPSIHSKLLSFTDSLPASINGHKDQYKRGLQRLLVGQYEFHLDQFMQLELDSFKTYSNDLVDSWDRETHDKEVATEHYYFSNVTKEKDKRDFLSSFKDVLMLPINVIGVGGGSRAASQSGTPAAQSEAVSPSELDLPITELDAKAAIMNDRLQGINSLFSLELALNIIKAGKASLERIKRFSTAGGQLATDSKELSEQVFVSLVEILGKRHIGGGFDRALARLDSYKPHNTLVEDKKGKKIAKPPPEEVKPKCTTTELEPLVVFAELVNIGDLIQQMIHVFFEEELAQRNFIDRNDFVSPSVQAKKKFEKMLDECVARGLNQGIDVLSDQMDFLFVTTQLGSDFNPLPNMEPNIGPTECAKGMVELLAVHMKILSGSTEKTVLDVFQQELGMRFFASICKHLKRQTISVDGAITVISDLNYYYSFIFSLKQRPLNIPFAALKEVGQMYLIDTKDAKALGKLLSDMNRFKGVFQPEEIFEFAHSRADWVQVKREVEKAMYGLGVDCIIM